MEPIHMVEKCYASVGQAQIPPLRMIELFSELN